jgi:solute carrier family 36 (proton-coupled amino acid transporter)
MSYFYSIVLIKIF